ncbi:MAG: bifunctional (p)ppGpp synthetase/guanosine-3',5'-bis(diphosphate) 3'-pyrophosphohydrolase [Chloroflexi bacterium]|nr:bifunctional (p)ppGpp synthetase/guanosine-3',5'-bis(diphosphate) 3'-pyrophosphohydrolase [Chloroflexota bacterium]MBI3168120.1 bifunctional (p)ppGpp synthetase/guanosine-3',5'-bis(diphosphate) 3'-pyrophosphohydrolase [Chloroflexota bacterium]
MEETTGMIFKALRFSADKHNDQRRRDSKSSPYINHPIQVVETLWAVGGVRDGVLLAAAILHDTIEDTDATPDEIRREFGEEVLGLVLEVTDDKSLPKQVRKQLQIENAPHKSLRAKMLKLADKLCNVRDIVHLPPADWSLKRKQEYLLWTEKVVKGLRGANKDLETHYDEALKEGKQILGME